MLYRLVRPVKRTGSSKQQFVQRIPADLRERMVGMKLAVPIGEETAFVTEVREYPFLAEDRRAVCRASQFPSKFPSS